MYNSDGRVGDLDIRVVGSGREGGRHDFTVGKLVEGARTMVDVSGHRREGLGEVRGVRARRYFEGPPKHASTSARSPTSARSLSGESSDRSKEIASFPSALPARDMAAEAWAAEIGSTGCATMFPWECA